MKTILLIEDHEQLRLNTAELLELAGYAVQTAANGQHGIELAQAGPPDLVVCDIMLPGLDGYGVLARFRQSPRLTSVPFLFLTAKIERADRRHGMALGADDYLTKPFEEADLLGAISGRLSRFHQLRTDYDLPGEGLAEFLNDARAAGGPELAQLSGERKTHLIRKKQDIYLEAEEPTRVFFVKAGRVKTVKTTAGGKELITGLYGPGEFFGYPPLLEETHYQDSAVAVDETELVYIPREDFTRLLRNPAVGRQFIRLLAGRVNEREQLLLGMAYNSIRRRVADALLHLHAQAAEATEGHIRLSREDLAAVVGTAPESVIRTLSEFSQGGLIELSPKTIRVLAPDQLRRAHW